MNTVDLNDPARIKALAHPIRLSLLEFLASVPHATATQCAEAIGESVASCSFHLRTLAKHGYIELAESADSKSKPWQIVGASRSNTYDKNIPESLPALSALGTAVISQVTERLSEAITALPTLPQEAVERTMLANVVMWLTDKEHEELMEQLLELCAQFTERGADATTRPEDASLTRLFIAATPDLARFRDQKTD